MARTAGYDQHAFIAEFYDYLPVVAGRRDLDFYQEFACGAGDPILELGCGTGRILLPLAEAGHRIVGLDLSEQMVSRARAKMSVCPREVQERVRLVRGDMTHFDLDEAFRLLLVPFRPFQHLIAVEEQLACLRCANRHLSEGGKLVLDLFHTDARRMHDPVYTVEFGVHPQVELPDGRKVVLGERIAAFHRAEQTNDVELIYYVTHPDGRHERLVYAFTIRYFFRYEVEHLLERCGFRIAELFGDYDGSPLGDSSPEMIFIAEKAASL